MGWRENETIYELLIELKNSINNKLKDIVIENIDDIINRSVDNKLNESNTDIFI